MTRIKSNCKLIVPRIEGKLKGENFNVPFTTNFRKSNVFSDTVFTSAQAAQARVSHRSTTTKEGGPLFTTQNT